MGQISEMGKGYSMWARQQGSGYHLLKKTVPNSRNEFCEFRIFLVQKMPKLTLKEYQNLSEIWTNQQNFERNRRKSSGIKSINRPSTPFCLQNHSQHQVFNNQYTGHSSNQDQVQIPLIFSKSRWQMILYSCIQIYSLTVHLNTPRKIELLKQINLLQRHPWQDVSSCASTSVPLMARLQSNRDSEGKCDAKL